MRHRDSGQVQDCGSRYMLRWHMLNLKLLMMAVEVLGEFDLQI
jgi:hypothetical protein